MNKFNIETYTNSNSEIELYLTEAITNYGMDQLKGNKPVKLYSCLKSGKEEYIGAVMGSITNNMLFISHLFVEKSNRNNGLGKILLSTIENLAVASGCNLIRLNTFNKKAHSFYIDAGYDETVCIEHYMNGFDLVYYHKNIKE